MLFGIINSGYTVWENLVVILTFGLSVMIALVLHEYAHAWMALKQGDPSAKMAGRLSLNPARHVEPLGLLCFIIIGVGWAKPVPVNPFNYRNFRRGNFLVSIAGITLNLIIGFLCSLGFYLFATYGNLSNIWVFLAANFFMFSMVINLSLMVFNLLPIPPLDGYNMLVSFTKPNNGFMKFMRENGFIVLLIIMLFGGYFISPIRNSIIDLFVSFWKLLL